MRYSTDIMKDTMFWSRLEFAACGWLAKAKDPVARKYWIDGFAPEEFRRTNAGAEISGQASVVGHQSYQSFRFITCLPWRIVNRSRETFEVERIEVDEEAKTVALTFRAALKEPNKAPEPTPTSVMSRANERRIE